MEESFRLFPILLLYFFISLYSAFYTWIFWFTHWRPFNKKSYIIFFIFSIIIIALSGIATVLSSLSFDDNLMAKILWHQHFKIGTDIIMLSAALIRLVFAGKKIKSIKRYRFNGDDIDKELSHDDLREFLVSIAILLIAILVIISTIGGILMPSEIYSTGIGSWYVGMIGWILWSLTFVFCEIEYIIDMCLSH